jgi:hypothetical protein
VDLTKPNTPPPQIPSGVDIWVVGVPVYASRIPQLSQERISKALESVPGKTAAIAVALYGNVDVGAGLKQLVDLLSANRLHVIGAGEFVGEHYFKKFHGLVADETAGRPNKVDLAVARELGSEVLKKGLEGSDIASIVAIQSAKVPFKLRFSDEKRVLGLLGSSTVDSNKCTKC